MAFRNPLQSVATSTPTLFYVPITQPSIGSEICPRRLSETGQNVVPYLWKRWERFVSR